MAKRTFEEKQKRQRDKLMGTTSTAEGKEYTPAVDEKDKLIEKYRKKGYKIILENNTPIILCKDRKEMMDIKERIGITNFSIGFKFSPSKYDDLLDKPLIDDRIPIKSKEKTNNNSRKKCREADKIIEKTEPITTVAINISDKEDNINEEKTDNIKEEIFNGNKPKRRGRPKKVVKEDIEESKPITKRGRPKKNIEDTVVEPITTAKKRGRPKKDVVLGNETLKVEEKPKAKRGRPRKEK